MIPARKSALFTRWFRRDAQQRLRRTFGSLRVRGLGDVARTSEESPVLFVSNHTAWWDPLLILELAVGNLRLDAYALMDARNLRRLPFFAKVGAFGVDLDDPADGARALRYAAKLLDRPGRAVWVFPQGAEVPVTARPLVFRAGAAQLARLARTARVIPVALRYEQGASPRPDILVSFGRPLAPERVLALACAAQEAAVTAELDALDRALVTRDLSGFELLHEARPSLLATCAERALACLTRPR